MAAQRWEDLLKSSKKTALVHDGKRKIHFLFEDGRELAEEYDLETDDLLGRKWRSRNPLGAPGPWEPEVGEAFSAPAAADSEVIRENLSNPVFLRQDTKTTFQWRIRNLPYPQEVFSVSVEPADRCCVVRTSNKKYYKRFVVADLDRCQLPLDGSALTFTHANNTLIISYKKPREVLTLERNLLQELKKLEPTGHGAGDCKTQYYKRFVVADLDRCQLPLDGSALTFTHANNTLIISYKKPREVLTLERNLLQELKKLEPTGHGAGDCKTQ